METLKFKVMEERKGGRGERESDNPETQSSPFNFFLIRGEKGQLLLWGRERNNLAGNCDLEVTDWVLILLNQTLSNYFSISDSQF